MARIFLVKIFVFLLILLIPVFLVSRFDNRIVNPENLNIARILNAYNYDSLDYLIIGNSHSYSSVYPPYFDSLGVEVYNYGLAGAGLMYFDMIYDDYLANVNDPPKNVIISVSPYLFSSQSDQWDKTGYHRSFNPPISTEELLLKYDFDLDKYLKILQRSFIKGFHYARVREDTDPDYLIRESDDYRGFYHRYDTFSTALYNKYAPMYMRLIDDEFPLEESEALLRFIEKIKSNGIKPHVIEPPRNRLDDFFSQDYLDKYEKCLVAIEKSGIPVFRNKLKLDTTLYRDIDHLNIHGAKVYTRNLLKELKLVPEP